MTTFVLYHRRSRPTGRKLREALGARGSTVFPWHLGRQDVLVRWGSAAQPSADTLANLVINHAHAINLASDKLRAFRAMSAEGVSVPPFGTNWSATTHSFGAPTIGRTRHGSGGQGITVYTPGEVVGEHELWVDYIENDREYRLHVVGEEVIRVQRKYLDYPELAAANPYIKNHAHGYRFRTPRTPLHRDRLDTAISAVHALGLDFGAVDLIIGHDGQEYVLEVNTAPGLFPRSLGEYAEALTKYIHGLRAI